jgi:ketosteroid isomerase-like protein
MAIRVERQLPSHSIPRHFADNMRRAGIVMSTATPEQVLRSIVDGINAGNLDALMTLYDPEAAFATQPGSLAHGLTGVRESLAGFIAMKGTLDLKVTRVLEASDLALVIGGVVIHRNRARR